MILLSGSQTGIGSEWPLTADKYASWVNKLAPKSELLNIFLDYETFGEHNWKESGIFDFLSHMPAAILKKTPFRFMTPTEVADSLQPVSAINIHSPISWADEERDITAWHGNELQVAALDKLYSLSRKVNKCEDQTDKKRLGISAVERPFLLYGNKIFLRWSSACLFQSI